MNNECVVRVYDETQPYNAPIEPGFYALALEGPVGGPWQPATALLGPYPTAIAAHHAVSVEAGITIPTITRRAA